MKRTALLMLGALIGTFGARAGAQEAPAKLADSLSAEIDRATLSGDLTKLQAARALAERAAAAYPNDGLILHYEAFALFREAGARLTRFQGSEYPLLERAQPLLERSLQLRPLPETYALLASVQGQLATRDPSRAMELGMAASQSLATAAGAGPNNPRVWLVRGLAALYTPPEYGGGPNAAEAPLRRSIELFANDSPRPGEPSWGKAESHAWLGQVYEKLGDKTKAASEYALALQIAPSFLWAQTLATALK